MVWACEAYHGIHVLLLVASLEITNCPRTIVVNTVNDCVKIVQIDVLFSEVAGTPYPIISCNWVCETSVCLNKFLKISTTAD